MKNAARILQRDGESLYRQSLKDDVMSQPNFCHVSGTFFVSCLCAALLSNGNELRPSATDEKTPHVAAAEPATLMRPTAATPSDTRIMLLRHADVSRNLGDYSTAEKIVRELLESIENSLDADEAEVAIGLTKLGLLCLDQDKNAEAKVYYQRALAIIDNSRASGLSANLTPSNVQAHSETAQELYPDSEVVYQRLLSFLAHRAGHEDPMVAITLRDLAEFYRQRGRLADAATYYDYALAILRTTLGADHPEYRFTNESYFSMQREQERLSLKDF